MTSTAVARILRYRVASILIGIAASCVPARAAFGQSADNVLLVVNDRSPASMTIADQYTKRRNIPADHIVRLSTVTSESISRTDYENTIESPISDWLTKHSLQDRILYFVLTKGVPLRVDGTGGASGTVASVDSELTMLYRKMLGIQPTFLGHVDNPYFLDQRTMAEAKPFSRAALDIYLVARLDGFTVEDVLALIDRGASPSKEGNVVLDQRVFGMDTIGDRWLNQAATQLRGMGFDNRVVLEASRSLVTTTAPALGYYSWGSNDRSNRLRRFGIPFAPGAIGGLYVSTDARTFNEPPATWAPNDDPQNRFGTQSLTGDLIRDGITGVSGHVAEPYLNATIRPQILFPAYFSGFNLVESFYLAMPFLSWQTIIVGDPLCRPFDGRTLSTAETTFEMDAATKLPSYFANRRLTVLSRAGLNREALQLWLRADYEISSGAVEEGEALLVKAADLEPRLDVANLRLAELYRSRRETDKAIERYRRVLASDPRNLIALNNLSFALADDKSSPKEALPFAQRAYELAPIPLVADTLAWVYYLLGDVASATPLIERAVIGAPGDTDVLLHAAFIHELAGDVARAARELEAAAKLTPGVLDRPEVRALRERLKPPPVARWEGLPDPQVTMPFSS